MHLVYFALLGIRKGARYEDGHLTKRGNMGAEMSKKVDRQFFLHGFDNNDFLQGVWLCY